ncbi:MAG: hypothetical protein CMI03_14310 [Oceanospirillaceae bacterium]|nr:hypothetical protein [Oceanospirillaceae bacterium]MBL33641.1 hypothetical protein [Oceanospirillaceae bacterium]MBS53909.1 hypothetical protein [Oceanospirillaceae bacterium]
MAQTSLYTKSVRSEMLWTQLRGINNGAVSTPTTLLRQQLHINKGTRVPADTSATGPRVADQPAAYWKVTRRDKSPGDQQDGGSYELCSIIVVSASVKPERTL